MEPQAANTREGESGKRTLMPILRAVGVRILVYSLFLAIATITLFDFSSLGERTNTAGLTHSSSGVADVGWPHYRGNGYDGRSSETNLADAWPAKGPPILWMIEIGAGYSGFVGRGGRIYTQTQTLTEQHVIALDADSGQTIWEQGYGWPYEAGGMFPGPRATPTLSNGRVYFAAPNGFVGCLDANDGHEIWSVNVLQRFSGRGTGFGYACSPVVEEGLVILPVGGPSASVVALDANTGVTRWASGSAPASYCSALPITFAGRRQVAVFLQNSLAGLDLKTGQLLWQQAYDKGFEEHAAALLYDEPYLRAMQAYRAGSDLYELQAAPTAERSDSIKRLRHDAQMSNDIASSILIDGNIYGFDLREMQANGNRPSRGSFRCMDFKTGQIRWSSDKPGHANMVAADGKLLMLNDSGEVVLVRINPQKYEELARVQIFPGEICWAPPTLYGGRLFVRSPTRAACLFVGKPELMTAQQRAFAAMPVAASRSIHRDITWLLGATREYPFELPDLRELTAWYVWSMIVLLASALAASLTSFIARFCFRYRSGHPATAIFFLLLLYLGITATPFANHHSRQFVFTWPLALLAVQQVALIAASRPKQMEPVKGSQWLPIVGTVLLMLICLIYFKLTRQLKLAPAWYFLVMLPAAWPLAIPLARRYWRATAFLPHFLWMFVIFSLYFWATSGVMLLRTHRFDQTIRNQSAISFSIPETLAPKQ